MINSTFLGKPSRAKLLNLLCLVALTASSGLAHAEWVLDNSKSTLSFVSTKAVDVGELHYFERLSGAVNEAGKASLTIDLTSVDTAIEIRDERMQNMLFETDRFPSAVLTTEVPIEALASLQPGETQSLTLDGELSIHGITAGLSSEVSVIKLADGSLQVNSNKPVLLNAKDLSLLKGIEKLREVAGLPSISQSVTVSFQLNFRQ